jgi:hypothetical protein
MCYIFYHPHSNFFCLKTMKGICNSLEGLMPIMLMLISQIALAATNIISKLAINDGMSMRVATAYRFIFASAFTIPVALIFDRYVSTFILFYTFIFASPRALD